MAEVPDYLAAMFNQFGLGDLAAWYLRRVTEGATMDQIMAERYDQPAYQARFPAMAALRQRGQAITESEYVSMEKTYADSLYTYGLRGSVYDNRTMFAKLIESQVSPRELEERLQDAKMVADSTDPNVKSMLSNYYGITSSDLMSYALDPKGIGKDHVEQLARTATLSGIAKSMSLQMSKGYAESLATDSVFDNRTEADYREALAGVSTLSQAQKRLASIEGTQFTDEDAADAVIKRDATKVLASQQRAARERARFAGRSGLTQGSLSKGSL